MTRWADKIERRASAAAAACAQRIADAWRDAGFEACRHGAGVEVTGRGLGTAWLERGELRFAGRGR